MKNQIQFFKAFIPSLLLGLLPFSAVSADIQFVAVGGGGVSDEMNRHLLSLSPAEEPSVLVIPYAARENQVTRSGERNAEMFRDIGVSHVEILDLDDREDALRKIKNADVFWMPGGGQLRLMRKLDEADVADAIRERVTAGVPIGGSSAGAAIMSETMLGRADTDENTGLPIPVISHGLGFWPEVVVDQHFTERNRLPRLEITMTQHPDLVGVGIDERTAVIVKGNEFQVMGEGTVTVLRVNSSSGDGETAFEKTILSDGDSYTL